MQMRLLPSQRLARGVCWVSFDEVWILAANKLVWRPALPLSFARLRSRDVANMVRISVLADALKTMYNAEKKGKR